VAQTAAGITVSGPGVSASEVFSFSCNSAGGDVIDVTTVNQAEGSARSFVKRPLSGGYLEATISYYGSGAPSIGDEGTVTIGDVSFYGVCTSRNGTAAVNEVAQFEASFREIQSPT
jgi:hypothetical protein